MTTARSKLAFLALPLVALALAGCGGGDESTGGTTDTGTTTGTTTGSGDPESTAYQGAFSICSLETPEELAEQNGIPGATDEEVAETVAELVGGGLGEEDRANGVQGCLAGFATQK
jgi:hypothetical protein